MRISPVLLPCLVLACSKPETPPEATSQTDAKQTDAKQTDAKAPSDANTPSDAKAPSDANTPSDAKAPSDPPPPAATSDASTTFQLAALREGPLQLAVAQGEPILLSSGQPIAIDAQGVPRPDPALGKGLRPRPAVYGYMFETIAFGGSLAGEAWVTTQQDHDRAATEYDVYVRRDARWQRQPIEKGPLVEYYGAYVELAGEAASERSLLGLRAYSTNPVLDVFEFEDESDEAKAFARASEKAFAKAERGFVHLSGPAPGAMPRVPGKLVAYAGVTSEQGSLYALAQPPAKADDTRGDAVLLVWTPGKVEPEQVSLPSYGDKPALAASGALVLVGGAEQIGVVRGNVLESIPRADMPPEPVSSLAASPAGELWVVVGDYHYLGGEGDNEALWVRPAPTSERPTPTWRKVGLPTPTGPLANPGPRRAWDPDSEGWSERDRAAIVPEPQAVGVVHARGAVWVVADLGRVWAEDYSTGIIHRSGLFTNLAGTREVVELEPVDHMQARQYAALGEGQKPGDEHCMYPSIILAKASDAEAVAEKLEAQSIYTESPFIGELDGKRELVLPVASREREDIASLPKLLADMPDVTIDCRPRMFVEAVEDE